LIFTTKSDVVVKLLISSGFYFIIKAFDFFEIIWRSDGWSPMVLPILKASDSGQGQVTNFGQFPYPNRL
jgi:hypothetical protein